MDFCTEYSPICGISIAWGMMLKATNLGAAYALFYWAKTRLGSKKAAQKRLLQAREKL
jgi:hypothetical protein